MGVSRLLCAIVEMNSRLTVGEGSKVVSQCMAAYMPRPWIIRRSTPDHIKSILDALDVTTRTYP